jgi:hypothetical protein
MNKNRKRRLFTSRVFGTDQSSLSGSSFFLLSTSPSGFRLIAIYSSIRKFNIGSSVWPSGLGHRLSVLIQVRGSGFDFRGGQVRLRFPSVRGR